MIEEQEDVLLLHHRDRTRPTPQPAMPEGVEDGIVKGMYLLEEDKRDSRAATSS